MQQKMEENLLEAIARYGWTVKRAHGYDEKKGHGFIDYQHVGVKIFRKSISFEINPPINWEK